MSKARRNDKLDKEIRELIGHNQAMVEAFREVVVGLHREMEAVAVRRNCAIREVKANFAAKRMASVRMVGNLRKGQDPSEIVGFDEMAAFAATNYPDLIAFSASESSVESPEEGLRRLLVEGIKPVPQPWDAEVLNAAVSCVGSEFFASYDPPTPVTQDPQHSVAKVDNEQVEKSINRLEAYFAKIEKSIEDERAGAPAIGWPRYRLSRLRNEINKLPTEFQLLAIERARLRQCEQMVHVHTNPVGVPF